MSMIKKVYDTYKKMAAPAKASLWFVVCNVIYKARHFITIPIYTRIMSTEQYGTYSVFNSWVLLIGAFASLNLQGNSYTVGMIKNEDRQDEYTASILGLWWANTAGCFLVMLPFRKYLVSVSGIETTVFVAAFADIFVSAGFNLWMARQRIEYKYKALLILTASVAITTPIISIPFVLGANDRGIAAILCQVAVLAIHSLITSWLILRRSGKLFDGHFWKAAYVFNLPLIAYYLSSTILNQSDRLMINKFCGSSDAGIYGIAYSFATILTVLSSAVYSAFAPWEFRNIKRNFLKNISEVSILMLLLIGAANLALIAVAPEVIKIVTTKEYYGAMWVIPPVALSSYLMSVYQLFVNLEFYYEKNKVVMVASIAVAVLNIILNLMFVPQFGYIAAAYTTLASYLVFAVVHYIFAKKFCNANHTMEKIYNIRLIIGVSLMIAAIAAAFMATYELPYIRYGILTALCVCVAWFLYRKRKILGRLLKLEHSVNNNSGRRDCNERNDSR